MYLQQWEPLFLQSMQSWPLAALYSLRIAQPQQTLDWECYTVHFCLFLLVFLYGPLVHYFSHSPFEPFDTVTLHNLLQQLPVVYHSLYKELLSMIAVKHLSPRFARPAVLTLQTAVLHLLFIINCLYNLENITHTLFSFRIPSPNWKVPDIFIFPVFQYSFVSSLTILLVMQITELSGGENVCAPNFWTVKTKKNPRLSGLLTRQHWDRLHIILNKSAWHQLQKIYVMGLSKLSSSSSVFSLFFTLLLHAHIPPSQVHTALQFFLLHLHFPSLPFQL